MEASSSEARRRAAATRSARARPRARTHAVYRPPRLRPMALPPPVRQVSFYAFPSVSDFSTSF